MKTKIFTLFLALGVSVGTMFAWDYEHVQIGNLYYHLDATNKIAEVTYQDIYDNNYSGLTTANFPVSIEYNAMTYSVTSIGYGAFYGCSSLTSVNIPNSVTSIGNDAFYGCTGLTSVTIGNSVTSIGYGAFRYCTGLTSVTIPNSVTSIGSYAFEDCSSLTSVTIGNSVTSIGNSAFRDCTGLTSVTIPNSVTNIFNCAFRDCTGLTSVTIGNSVTSIGDYAFSYCTGLTSITIPNSVTNIGEHVFAGCTGLSFVTIGNSVTSIGDNAFRDCTGLTSMTCFAKTPPSFGGRYVFWNAMVSIPLYVPVGSISAYKADDLWKYFNIQPIAAENVETTTVKAEPTTNSVEVTWPAVSGAYTYELVIKDKYGNIICTLTFNAQGQLISIAFNALGRDGAPQQKQGAGFSFVVDGLDSGTEYSYDITAKDENGNVLDTKSGSFSTQAPQGIDDINAATKSQKIVRDNQVLILRGDKTYTLTGQEVK